MNGVSATRVSNDADSDADSDADNDADKDADSAADSAADNAADCYVDSDADNEQQGLVSCRSASGPSAGSWWERSSPCLSGRVISALSV